MKTNLVFCICLLLLAISSRAQVTQINSNKSLHVKYPLTSTKTIVVSDIDSSIWVSDATLLGTVQISPTIKYEEAGAVISGKLIFRGSTAATGSEIYSTDGTPGGTGLVKDIYAGATGSIPGEMILMGEFIFFTAATAAEGRELWRTNGTLGGTTLVKDIVPGTDSSNTINGYHLFTNGLYLLFAAKTASAGIELWMSDGSPTGTAILKDINTGNAGADSSNPASFYKFNSIVLFTAKDATHGEEIWKTDGTPGGTVILKDINPGTANSTTFEIFPGFDAPVFQSFHTFNNRAYFNAYDGTSTGEIWSTDGNPLNTSLLKDIIPGTSLSFISVIQAVNLPAKFIFPVSDGSSISELWESDGTPGGTNLFKSFSVINPGDMPFIFIPYSIDLVNGTFNQSLFQGTKFFFTAATLTEGNELWVSNGTLAGTNMVKDIYPGADNGINIPGGISYLYTSTALFFKGTTGGQGDELWRTDGTLPGTSMVADIYTNAGSSNPELSFISNVNKIIFSATNGDDPNLTDLYVVDGNFTPIPIKLTDFTVKLKAADALLQWNTLQEINSKDFTIQRSYDAVHFENIGIVQAAGNTSNRHEYMFTDKGVVNCGKETVFYRLLISDMDGKEENSNVILLKLENKTGWDLRLLSNPVQHDLQILLSGTRNIIKFSISDMNGKIIYRNTIKDINGQLNFPVSMQPGVYVLIAENNNEIKTIKFAKK